MSFPETYKGFAFTEKHGTLQPITLPWKNPQEDEVVIKILACGVCGRFVVFTHFNFPIDPFDGIDSDEFLVEGFWGATYPRVPGHEIVGDIVQVHPGVKQWKVGQRVGGAWHGKHCFTCAPCRTGDYMHCHSEQPNGAL